MTTPTTALVKTEWIKGGASPAIEFYTKRWNPNNIPVVSTVLFVHGYCEHIERYNHVFESFASKGISVFAYDQRGFGQTAAKTNTQGATDWSLALGDISFFVSLVVKEAQINGGKNIFLMGHSMGGGLSLGFSTRKVSLDGLNNLSGIIVTAPLIKQHPAQRANLLVVRAGGLLGKLAPNLKIIKAVDPSAICRDPVVQEAYSKDPLCAPVGTFRGVSSMLLNGDALFEKDYKNFPKRLPIALFHGEGDLVTDHKASQEFILKLQDEGHVDATYKGYDGFYHEMHQEPGNDKWKFIGDLESYILSKSSG